MTSTLSVAIGGLIAALLAAVPSAQERVSLKDLAREQGGKIRMILTVCGPAAPMDFMASQADLIVQGRILSTEPRLNDDETAVLTHVTITPSRIFKNTIAAGTALKPGPTPPIVILEPGGTVYVDGLEISYHSDSTPKPPLEVGEEVIAFLIRKPGTDLFWLYNGSYGVLRLRNGHVSAASEEVAKYRPLERTELAEVQQLIARLVQSH